MNRKNAGAEQLTEDAPVRAFDELSVGYAELDTSGAVTYANRTTLASYPAAHGSLIGKTTWALMPVPEQERACAAYFLLMETGEEPPVVKRCFFTSAGEFRVYELHRSLMRNAEGRPTGMRVVSLDITEKEKALEAATAKSQWLESLLGSFPEAVIASDALGFIRYANAAAAALLGWTTQELVGNTFVSRVPILSYQSAEHETFEARVVLDQPSKGVATILDREGKELRVEIQTSPLVHGEMGLTAGVVSLLRKLEACD